MISHSAVPDEIASLSQLRRGDGNQKVTTAPLTWPATWIEQLILPMPDVILKAENSIQYQKSVS